MPSPWDSGRFSNPPPLPQHPSPQKILTSLSRDHRDLWWTDHLWCKRLDMTRLDHEFSKKNEEAAKTFGPPAHAKYGMMDCLGFKMLQAISSYFIYLQCFPPLFAGPQGCCRASEPRQCNSCAATPTRLTLHIPWPHGGQEWKTKMNLSVLVLLYTIPNI